MLSCLIVLSRVCVKHILAPIRRIFWLNLVQYNCKRILMLPQLTTTTIIDELVTKLIVLSLFQSKVVPSRFSHCEVMY